MTAAEAEAAFPKRFSGKDFLSTVNLAVADVDDDGDDDDDDIDDLQIE